MNEDWGYPLFRNLHFNSQRLERRHKVMSPTATAEQHRASVVIPRFRPECQGKTQVKSQA